MAEKRLVGEGSQIVAPQDEDIERYIRRMDVFEGLVEFSAPENFRRHQTDRFTPVERFETERDAAAVAKKLAKNIGFAYTEPIVWHLIYALVELTENVPLHSGADSGIVCGQGWLGSGMVEAVILDRGVGIAGSLKRNPRYADLSDEEALRKATAVRVSGLDDDRRGQGLWIISEIVKRNGGELYLRSGSAVLEQRGDRVETRTSVCYWPGSIVVLRLNAGKPLDISDVLDRHFPPENDYDFVEYE